MRVFINALSVAVGGGVTVFKQLLPALLEEDGGRHEYRLLVREVSAWSFLHEHPRVRLVPALSSGSGRLWSELTAPLKIFVDGADVVLSPGGVAIFGCPVPQVLMFQNAAPFTAHVLRKYRGTRQWPRIRALRALGILSGRVADQVVFISRLATRHDSTDPAGRTSSDHPHLSWEGAWL